MAGPPVALASVAVAPVAEVSAVAGPPVALASVTGLTVAVFLHLNVSVASVFVASTILSPSFLQVKSPSSAFS